MASPPVSTAELLLAANEASATARNAWLAFLGLMAYLLVAVAGVTHADLLLNSPIRLPLVSVDIPLFGFFSIAPVLLLLVHLSLLVQHAVLAHKFSCFSQLLEPEEAGRGRSHPDRRLVNSYVFSQLVAGPRPPRALEYLMRLMVFVTLSLLPILVLLYLQIKFLPYHNVAVTHVHRMAILVDLSLLVMVRPFVDMPYLRPPGRTFHFGPANWDWEISYKNLALSLVFISGVLFFSLFIATVPRGCFWPFGQQDENCFSLDVAAAKIYPDKVDFREQERDVFVLTKYLFEGEIDPIDGAPKSLFSRNIVVTDSGLAARSGGASGEAGLALRGRDLRFAMLDRSDLHRADLTGADLQWASLVNVRLGEAKLEDANLQGTDLNGAELESANLLWANLRDTTLIGADLTGANLSGAALQGADLSASRMRHANLAVSQLEGAAMVDARLQGAVLSLAELVAVDVSGASLENADLTGSNAQGADFSGANLQGVNFSTAQLQGADLRNAAIWGSVALEESDIWVADLSTVHTEYLEPADPEIPASSLPLSDEPLSDQPPGHADGGQTGAMAWEESEPYRFWAQNQASPDPVELSAHLAQMICLDTTGGYIARGVIRRSMATPSRSRPHNFNGDLKRLTRIVTHRECDGTGYIGEKTLLRLCKIAEWEPDQVADTYCKTRG